jgi:hypothetical protein
MSTRSYISTTSKNISPSMSAQFAFYDYCEYALFKVYEVEICSPEGNSLPELIEAEYELFKEGKRDLVSLYDFVDTLEISPAIPQYKVQLYLASLFVGEILDAFRAQQKNKSEGGKGR